MVCVPVRYVPDAIVWSVVEVLIVAVAFVVIFAVRLTAALLAVPFEI